MSKVALYFKRFKNYSRHRKLNEDWSFASISLKDFNEISEENDLDIDSPQLDMFQVKFLGNIEVESPKSEEETAAAIKKIVSQSKASNKKPQRINLNVCPKGIETFDAITGETVHEVSIYKISYCSADATHSNVFAFIGGEDIEGSKSEKLTCYAFLCPKRKTAHKLTLTVAQNFDRANELYQNSEQQRKYKEHVEQMKNVDNLMRQQSKEEKRNHSQEILVDQENSTRKSSCDDTLEQINQDENIRNLLIDFNTEIIAPVDLVPQQKFLQNTWVSFDDEPQICENSFLVESKAFENSMWERRIICS